MDQETAARVRRAHTIRIWAGSIVLVIGLVYAFGNPLWGGQNTTLEIVIGLVMAAAGVLNIVLSVIGLRKLRTTHKG
jgi:drug/metabolite transporter (DMT)-like permease